jgi:hypothetical protein
LTAYRDSPSDKVLSRLHKVRKTGDGQWLACCPAHDDKTPSMTVREVDGRLLVHCFSGCSASNIMASLGLSLGDLFDAPLEHHKGGTRLPFSPAAVLRALQGELLIIAIAGRDILDGKGTESDRARMLTAIQRVEEASRHV